RRVDVSRHRVEAGAPGLDDGLRRVGRTDLIASQIHVRRRAGGLESERDDLDSGILRTVSVDALVRLVEQLDDGIRPMRSEAVALRNLDGELEVLAAVPQVHASTQGASALFDLLLDE